MLKCSTSPIQKSDLQDRTRLLLYTSKFPPLMCFELCIISVGLSCKNWSQSMSLPVLKAFSWCPWPVDSDPISLPWLARPHKPGLLPLILDEFQATLAFLLFSNITILFHFVASAAASDWKTLPELIMLLAPFHPLDFDLNVTSSVSPPPRPLYLNQISQSTAVHLISLFISV